MDTVAIFKRDPDNFTGPMSIVFWLGFIFIDWCYCLFKLLNTSRKIIEISKFSFLIQ